MRYRAAWGGCGWASPTSTRSWWPGTAEGKDSTPLAVEISDSMSGVPGFQYLPPPIFRKGVQCRDLKRRGIFCIFFLIKQVK